MSWSEFWNKPVLSYGTVAVIVWLHHVWKSYWAKRAEEMRRYQEKYPLGKPCEGRWRDSRDE